VTGFLLLAFLILVAGIVSVPVAARFGLGSVLGYLLAGMAIAPLLGALDVDVEALQVFAEFGVVMMLFIVGLELEPKKLWAMRGKLLGTGGGQVLLTTLAIAAVALVDGQPWQTALAIGMILALSSTAIVVQTLTEKGLLKSRGGESAFSVLLFQDVAVIPILALLPLLALPSLGVAGGEGGHGHGLDLTAELPALLAALVRVAAVVVVVLIGVYLTRPVFRWIAAANLRELFTAAALVFVIGIALLMSLAGLSPALGTFLAGVVLANSEYRHELESDIEPFKGLLLGLFFITVGASVDFGLLADRSGEVLFWALVTIAVKVAVLLLVGRLSGLRSADLWLFALALPQAGEFAFVLIAFAVGNAILPGPLADLILLVVAATMLATPLLFILYDKGIARLYCTRQAEREADAIAEDNPIIIAGRGRMGGIIDRMLEAAGYRATVIDYNADHLENLKKFGIKTYFGDATRPDLLASAGIARARLLVVALDEREQIDKLVQYAVRNFPGLHVIARAKDRHHVYELWAMGCRDVIRETYDSALRMGRSAYEALGFDRQTAQAMTAAWEERDRTAMREVADLYRLDIPAHENEAFVAKIKEMRAEWDPKLRDMMEAIAARGRSL
jgi:monovalent cation:H+ antiporter-2, CPA2 family